MTANTDTTCGCDSRNDTSDGPEDCEMCEGRELSDLTMKQQALIIAKLAHPDDQAVTIATRVGSAQSYPSQVYTEHSAVLDELRSAVADVGSVVAVIESELEDEVIAQLVAHGLLDDVEIELTDKYGGDGVRSRSGDSVASPVGEQDIVDLPVTEQRSFMSAGPRLDVGGAGDTGESGEQAKLATMTDTDADTMTETGVQTDTGIEAEGETGTEEKMDSDTVTMTESDNDNIDTAQVRDWYAELTNKKRAIVDVIAEYPDATDTRRAELASQNLPGEKSVSRAYVSKMKAECEFLDVVCDRPDLVFDQDRNAATGTPSGDGDGDPVVDEPGGASVEVEPEQHGLEANTGADTGVDTGDTGTGSEGASGHPGIVADVERVRDRVAFTASILEREYSLQHTGDVVRADGHGHGHGHVHGTAGVAVTQEILAALDDILERYE